MKLIEKYFPTVALRNENARVSLGQARLQNQIIKRMVESPVFADTRDADEDTWNLSPTGLKFPLTDMALKKMREQAARLQYTAAGRNILQTLNDFIIGKNAYFTALDEDEKVQEYWDEWVKENKWDRRSKQFVVRLFRDGEVFLRWFKPVAGREHLLVRFIDPKQIVPAPDGEPTFGIKTDPDDIEKVEFYHREYARDTVLERATVLREEIPADEILHEKIMVDSDVKRGVTFFQGISKYMKEYEVWLRDRINLNKIRQMWAVVGKVEGVGTADVKAMFDDVTRKTSIGGTAKKKVPRPGGVFLQKGIEWDLKNLNIRATDTKDDGRAIQLMIALGTNFPEYITRGDASNANYASSMVSESPFVRAMESHQDYVEDPFKKIFEKVINYGMQIGRINKKSTVTVRKFDQAKKTETETKQKIDTNTDCNINFAALIHRDLKKESDAFAIHLNNRLASEKTIREKLDYDSDAELEQMAKEEHEEQLRNPDDFVPKKEKDDDGNDE